MALPVYICPTDEVFAWTDIALTGTLFSAWIPMTRLMVIVGGNLEAPSANIWHALQELRAEMQHAWLVKPVDLVVIGSAGGGKEDHCIMPLDLPGPVTWNPSYNPPPGVTRGGIYCGWSAYILH
jgi:hypothetical protein